MRSPYTLNQLHGMSKARTKALGTWTMFYGKETTMADNDFKDLDNLFYEDSDTAKMIEADRQATADTFTVAFGILFLVMEMVAAFLFGHAFAAMLVVASTGLAYVTQAMNSFYARDPDPFYYNVAMATWVASIIAALAVLYLLAYDASLRIA